MATLCSVSFHLTGSKSPLQASAAEALPLTERVESEGKETIGAKKMKSTKSTYLDFIFYLPLIIVGHRQFKIVAIKFFFLMA
jgi:hypothetical protein